MPLSEVHRATTKGKLESTQSKMTNCSSDVYSDMPDHEFVELLWENGQIVMQSQSNRPRKSSFSTAFPSHIVRVQEKDSRDATIPKIGRLGAVDLMVNDLSPSAANGNIGLNAQDDDMVPWINYPIEDSLQNDYCSEFLSELSGANLNPLSTHNNIMPTDRSSGFAVKDFHNVEHGIASKALTGGSEPSRIRTSQFFQLSQQCQSSIPSAKPRATDLGISGSSSSTHQGRFQKQDVASSKPLQPSISVGLMNFSHFSRPAALAKANLESVDRLRSNEKESTAASTNPTESTLIEPTGIRGHLSSDLPEVELRSSSKPHQEVVSVEQSEAICQEDTSRNKNHNSIANNSGTPPDHINHPSSSFTASMVLGRHDTEKGPEAVAASSSVCSGNSAGAASTDPKHRAKRKNREGEESGYQSEDLEDESVGLKKPATGRGGTSTKRSRAAEVHNLSERRRRDRINEKMRALQELIPNCNKVDKASMLDEAIEYLKTLQLHVQMMSMGSGLCMPPMMLPHGMQHLRGHPMAHFSPMGVGMGMGIGMGFGMGMLDMNGSPMMPVPTMHAPQFPCPSMPGSTGLQLFGIPGQGFPVSVPRSPVFGPLSGFTAKGNSTTEVPGMTTDPILVSNAAPPPSSKDQQRQSSNLEAIQKTSTNDSQVQTSSQATKGSFEKSQLMQMSNQTLHVSGNGANNSDTGNASVRPTSYG